MADVRIASSLRDVSRAGWNGCMAGELEDYDYLLAAEESGMAGFKWRYVTVEKQGNMVGCMPAFLTDYQLDTTLQGAGKKITGALKSFFPHMLTLRLACLGSPVTEHGMLGFHPDIDHKDKPSLLKLMLDGFEQGAVGEGYRLIAAKDVPDYHKALWDKTALDLGYRHVAGMPTAYITIDFTSIDDYLARLSSGTRKDMRRKLRALAGIRIEHRSSIDDMLPQVLEMYRQTRARSDWQFEELTEDYFRNMLEKMNGRAFCTLYYAGDTLLAANLLIRDDTTLLDKFFCMAEEGRRHNLYFLSWFTNVQYCIDHGLKRYQSGQEGYENKLRLGSRLTRNGMYFKHKNPLVHGVLRLASPLLAADETLKEAA